MNKIILQRGVSLIEVMISLGIGLFLLTGIAFIFLSNRATFITQGQLATLQNNEIIAMNIISNVIQSAGYYNSTAQSQITGQAITTPMNFTFAGGQAVYGGTVNSSDSIAVSSIGAMNCTGATSATLVSSTFSMDTNNNLRCSINSAASQTLVSGVSSMSLLYGADPGSTGSVTQYLAYNSTTPAINWSQVRSVRVTLNFVNPMASQAGQPATLSFTKVIGIMGQL